jgi:hypothetical protein
MNALRAELRAAVETIQERTSWANCGGVPTGIKCRVDGHEIYGGFQADADRSNAICDIHLLHETTAQLRAAVDVLRPFAHFAAKWNAKPLRGIDDEIYSIHVGEDGASLRLSGCQSALDFVAAYDAQHPEGK